MKTKLILLSTIFVASIMILSSCATTDPTDFNKKIIDKLWIKFDEGCPDYAYYFKSNGTVTFYEFTVATNNDKNVEYNKIAYKVNKDGFDWKWDADFDRKITIQSNNINLDHIYILKIGMTDLIYQDSPSSEAIKLETNSSLEKDLLKL